MKGALDGIIDLVSKTKNCPVKHLAFYTMYMFHRHITYSFLSISKNILLFFLPYLSVVLASDWLARLKNDWSYIRTFFHPTPLCRLPIRWLFDRK